MSDDGTRETEGAPPDPDTPSVARMYDFFLGGEDNFAVDRRAAEEVSRALPGVADVARSNREFLRRAVRFAAERGVDQFLDLGAGLPTQGNVHEIARSVHPAHASSMWTTTPSSPHTPVHCSPATGTRTSSTPTCATRGPY